MPHAIDEHARRQRILQAREPVGELQPAALLGGKCRRLARQRHAQQPARHLLPALVDLPADADLRVGDHLVFAPRHRGRPVRSVAAQLFQCGLEYLHARLDRRALVRLAVLRERRVGSFFQLLLGEKLHGIRADDALRAFV